MLKSGIYQITCTANGKIYVGQAQNVSKRLRQHRYALGRGNHDNVHLQHAFTKYGAFAFDFDPLIFCPVDELNEYEQIGIDAIATAKRFNIAPIAGSSIGGD